MKIFKIQLNPSPNREGFFYVALLSFLTLGTSPSPTPTLIPSQEPDLIAKIYEIGKTEGPPLFIQTRHRLITSSGITHDEIAIRDPSGKLALREDSYVKDGVLDHLKIEQFQLQETFEVIQTGKKAVFKAYTMNGDQLIPLRKDQTEDVTESFVAGPGLEHYILRHWKELMDGETLHIRFALAERADTVGLKLFKTKFERNGDQETAYLKMKPSSIFIAAIADPVEIIVDAKRMRILKFIGRSPLKKTENGKLKPLDAEIIYQ